jgi:hypothetical protein
MVCVLVPLLLKQNVGVLSGILSGLTVKNGNLIQEEMKRRPN